MKKMPHWHVAGPVWHPLMLFIKDGPQECSEEGPTF